MREHRRAPRHLRHARKETLPGYLRPPVLRELQIDSGLRRAGEIAPREAAPDHRTRPAA